jgi:hypothetical protein
VKTIRLSKELNDFLNDEANKSNITVSALASIIFTSYRDRYHFVDKLQPIALLPATLALFIEHISDEDLLKLGPIIASRLLMYGTHILDREKNPDGAGFYLNNLLPSSHWFSCFHSNESYMITHQMGKKWSVFLSSFLPSLI